MDILRPADKPYGSYPIALLIIGSLRRLDQTGIVAKSEIIVRTHAEQLSSILHLHPRALRRYKRRFALEQAGFLDSFHFLCINAQNIVFTCHRVYYFLSFIKISCFD